MTYDHDKWVKAWGRNVPMICGGINDEGLTHKLPNLPPGYDFLVTRDVTHGRNDEVFPTYHIALMQRIATEDDETYEMRVLSRGKIDKTMYGEGAVIELARSMKEKYCGDRRRSGGEADAGGQEPEAVGRRRSRKAARDLSG